MHILTIDIETTGLVWSSRILSVAVCYREGADVVKKSWNVVACDLFHNQTPIQQVRSELEPLIRQATYVVGHNLSFDLSFLFKYNLVDPDWIEGKTIDTLILARMVQSFESVSLFNVAGSIGITDPQWTKMKSKRGILDKVPVDTLLHYNETDTYYNLLVAEKLIEDGLKIYSEAQLLHEGDFASLIAQVRCNGIAVDFQKLETKIMEYTTKKRHFLHSVLIPSKIEGGNDATRIIKFLEAHSVPISAFTEKGKAKTDEDSLTDIMLWAIHECNAPLPQYPDASNDYQVLSETYDKLSVPAKSVVDTLGAVLAVRHYDKALSTWLTPLYDHAGEDGRVHALYSAAGAVSYRLTCSEPNLQAYPFLDIWEPYANADYSQAEYRFMAMYARSKNLAKSYAQGDDAHTATGKLLFGTETITKEQRKLAKVFNFASLYGAGVAKLVRASGMEESLVKQLQQKFKKNLPEIGIFTKEVNQRWVDRGYIQLWDGTRIWATEYDRQNRGYKGANQLCQGGVAKLTEKAMLELHRKGVTILGQIHDSIQFPLETDPELIKHTMENALDTRLENQTNPPIRMVADYEIKCAPKE